MPAGGAGGSGRGAFVNLEPIARCAASWPYACVAVIAVAGAPSSGLSDTCHRQPANLGGCRQAGITSPLRCAICADAVIYIEDFLS